MKKYLPLALLGSLINLFLVAACLGAQTSDVSGTWVISIVMETAARDSQEIVAIKQQGEKITGAYLGQFGEKEVAGTVSGNTVTLVIEVFRDGRLVKATYSGTIETSAKMAGTLEYSGDPGARGKWTAIRRDVNAKGKAGEVFIEPAILTTPETGNVHFQLGTIFVPENRADPKSRIIGVGFARFRALQPNGQATGAPPTFHLPGGPGDSYLRGFKQTNRLLARWLKLVANYSRISDAVFVDQRGNSERGEYLTYKFRTPEHPLNQPTTLSGATASFVAMARAAVAEFASKGVDLRGYTVKECADDVNDLRRALGYDRITLVGTSFGSQWSFAVMRRHPEIVARALLSGVEPLDYGYDMPSHVMAALQRQWWEAEKDARIKPYLPPGGLAAAAREVLRRLERAPVLVKVKEDKTGEMVTITLGKEDFQRGFPFGTGGPAALLSLYHEQYERWARSAVAGRRSRDAEVLMIGPLIDTSLGVTPRREHLLRTDAGTEFLGQWNFDSYLATADIWPSEDVGDDFRTELVSRIPVVFAQGDWDTSTPIENALNLLPFFPNGRLLIAVHGGHGVIEPIAENLPEVMATLLEFLQTGNMTNLPARVTLPVPKFIVPDFALPASKVRQ